MAPHWSGLGIDDVKSSITSAIEQLEYNGSFATFGAFNSLPDPIIIVNGLGPIKLPLTEETAQSLIKTCHQSPFGKGDQTIIDTSVRRTWELNRDQFHFENPGWQSYLNGIVYKALNELGLADGAIRKTEAQLYKMLLYEKGAMFKAHKE